MRYKKEERSEENHARLRIAKAENSFGNALPVLLDIKGPGPFHVSHTIVIDEFALQIALSHNRSPTFSHVIS